MVALYGLMFDGCQPAEAIELYVTDADIQDHPALADDREETPQRQARRSLVFVLQPAVCLVVPDAQQRAPVSHSRPCISPRVLLD